MALNLRKWLAELLQVENLTDDDVRRELDEIKIDNKVRELTEAGHIAANPEVQLLARKAVQGQASPEELVQLISSPRPAPAQTTTYTPPKGPAGEDDPVEAAIQAEMAKSNIPYHEAARVVSTGGTITPEGAAE